MKSKRIIRILVGILLLSSIGIISNNLIAQQLPKSQKHQNIDINVTISKETSEAELGEIGKMLAENDIESEFTSIERNEDDELLGLKITLKHTNQTVSSSMSNSTGLGKVSFGRKNGQLYISQDGFGSGNLAFFNMPNVQSFSFGKDSLFGQYPQNFGSFNFEEFFDDNGEAWFGNFNSESLEEFMEKMRSRAGSGPSGSSNQRYTFIDDPDTDKLIIIDGKESNFEELDRLSKEDKLKVVDFLQAETAISLYGEKAKDGAIIATTKD